MSDKWKDKLTDEQYRVMRLKGTEAPFSGKHLKNNKKGQYMCAACGQELFSSNTKFDSTIPGLMGWPSFFNAVDDNKIELRPDNQLDMERTEVLCKKCGSHLGHLFDDETSPNNKHYCINSCALDFKTQK